MSTPKLRRGGGGAKVTALPISAGKENPNPLRPTSRPRASVNPVQKPTAKPIPQFSRSNSASTKGRSSSPFEFSRALSDMRKNHGFGSNICEKDLGVRSVSSDRRSVSGDRVFDRCQPKIGSFRDLNVKSGNRVERVNLCLKAKGEKRDLDVKLGERVAKSEEICRKSKWVLGMSQQKNGVLRDSNAKTGARVEKTDGNLVGIEVAFKKSGEIYEKSEPGLKESDDLGSRVLDRSRQKIGSLKDSNVKLGERVEKRNGIIVRAEVVGMEKREDTRNKNNSGVKRSNDLQVRGLKERKSMGTCEGSKISIMDEGNSEDGLSSNLSRSRPGSSDSDMKRKNSKNLASSEREKSVSYTKDSGDKVSNALRGSERLKQKGLVEENVSGRSVYKYPSKLHEKLAFLEGKVKRIASDIKRTKEMLDMNNPDSSKLIISDIQEKISGIEKAMGNVADSDKQTNVLEKVDNNKKIAENEKVIGNVCDVDEQNNVLEKVAQNELENMKSSVKGLNSEELEARLFPHYKLLRDWTSSKVSSISEKLDIETKAEENLSSHVDENPVEVKFLASLDKDQHKVTVRGENVGAVQETDGSAGSKSQDSMNVVGKEENFMLTTDETLDDFGEQRIRAEITIDEEIEDSFMYQFNAIGHKTSTCGWFVADGEAALLAHDDGSCSYYDIANSEVKSEYKPPVGIPQNIWRDCWVVRAPGADGSSGRYVVAASAGNKLESGFCSWDFYVKDVRAYHMENETTNHTRTALAPLPNNPSYRRNSFSNIIVSENQQWWYRPCGPLISSTSSNQKGVCIYDIRDGEQIMKWEVQTPVLSMDYSSPLQWINRGKVAIAEAESVSLWDVSSLTPQALQSISTSGRRVYALHVNNTDAELGGGVRQRVSSSEVEGHDGVFCTTDSINVLDFRHPSGIGLKISKIGINAQSVFSRGDLIFLGCNNTKSVGKNQPYPQIQQFSLRKQKLVSTYSFPQSNAHPHYTAITQVWGNSNLVMGVCGLGLFVFDALKDDGVCSIQPEYCSMQKVRETIGPDDLYSPSFDYLSSRVLLISRDRPALWRYLL